MSKMSELHADLTRFQGQNLNSPTGYYYRYTQTKGTLYDTEIHIVVEYDDLEARLSNRIACTSLLEAENTINMYEAMENHDSERFSYFIDTVPIRT